MTSWVGIVLYCAFVSCTVQTTDVAEPTCGPNEVLDNCPASCSSDYCPTYDGEDRQACETPDPCPKPACKCRFNYRRAENGTCISTRDCPPFPCNGCNEEFNPCPPLCPTDQCSQATPTGECPLPGNILIVLQCSPRCRCKKNFWRNNGICIPYNECPNIKQQKRSKCRPKRKTKDKLCACKQNEEFLQNKTTCPPEICKSLVSRYDCSKAPPPQPGCACKSGYLRLNETSPCIPICECPELASSPDCQNKTCKDPNEEFVQEKSSCPPDTCEALVARIDCSKAPARQPGCTCKSGYRRLNDKCVPLCECPQMASSAQCQKQTCNGPNEEFVQEKRTCPPETCVSIVSKYDCSKAPPPQPGCACKSGYLRLNDTSPCIPICECPELASSPDCQNKTCKDPNEEFVQEKSSCPPDTCEALVARIDCSNAPAPQPGCTCKSGYRRLNDKCVPLCECPQMASSAQCQKQTCDGPNEEFVQEKSSCPSETCRSIVSKFDCSKAPPPQPGCACKSGYLRLNETSPCIPICECPEMASSPDCQNKTCKDPNEEFVQEKSSCPPDTCEALVARIDCRNAPAPQPGCTCKSGYRRLNDKCVPLCECPQMASSAQCQKQTCDGPNEEFVQEKSSCPSETCRSIVSKFDCSKAPPPQPGCACKSGYLRLNETSPCIPICECPEMASSLDCQNKTCKDPNEEFVQEKSSCPPDTCEALVARIDCSNAPAPQPGCTCKSGYRRLNDKCVPLCECPQMASSAQCQKQTCDGPNEEFVQEKRTCPSETCVSIVSNYDCSKAPPPQPGCACKSGYLRLNDTSPCIPICECPELASSRDCQIKTCKDPNEEFVQEKSSCPPDTCEAIVARIDCRNAPAPQPGCTCKSGYRRLNDKCVPLCKCPQMAYSVQCQKQTCDDPNEEFVQEKRTCPPETCVSIVSDYDCSKAPSPQPGCACKSGYLRLNETSPCIPFCECPEMASSLDCQIKTCKDPNEEFVQEKRTCPPDTCTALVSKFNCSNAPAPQPGCTCKSGYRRLNETCVPYCKCPQVASSLQCKEKKCDGPNEEFVLEKRTCPPETCISIVARFDCSKAPPPQPGCACKSGYLRLNATSPCIRMCKCPQISSSLDCLK